jgi:hypothetical protein
MTLTLIIYNFDDNNILINLFEVSKISIMQLNDNKIDTSYYISNELKIFTHCQFYMYIIYVFTHVYFYI